MPRSELSLRRLGGLLGAAVSEEKVVETLFGSKAEVEGRDGDRLDVSVTPDRLDLLSEGGLALYLQGALGLAEGPAPIRRARSRRPTLGFELDRSVAPLRPHLAGVVVRAPVGAALDAETLEEAVRFQELLHATLGRDRRAMSLGLYPIRRLASPVRYALEPIDTVRFTPLHGTQEVPAREFLATDPMAARYGALGVAGDRCLTLRDQRGSVLSLPPILNSATAGEARPGDRRLLIESTGTRPRAVREALGLLLVVFVARRWSVEPVPVRTGGSEAEVGPTVLAPAPVELPAATVRSIAGEAWSAEEIAGRLRRVRLSARRVRGGWRVIPPPWRPDLGTAVDVAEDVLLARELRPEVGVVPPSSSRGRHRPETIFRRRFARLLLGLGFQQPHTPVLVSDAIVRRLGGSPLRLANPVSLEFAYLRERLLPSHLGVLERNTRHGYPQRFAEVGPVVVLDPAAEAGGATRYHASLVTAGEGTGFAEVAALVDYLLRTHDVGSVREPAEIPGTIPGRAARVRVAGEPVAELGEIAPELLTDLGVPVPAAWAEVDLSALWPLVGGRDTA